MTPDDIKKLRELCERATPDCGDNSCAFALKIDGMRTNGGCRCGSHQSRIKWSTIEKYAFVLREWLPKLLDEVEELTKNFELSTYAHNQEINKLLAEIDVLEKLNDKLSTDPVNREAVLGATKEELDQIQKNYQELHHDFAVMCGHYNEALKERDRALARVERLEKALKDSEMFRQKYREGKLKLYAMKGEIAQAAMSHLPCGEGPLETLVKEALSQDDIVYSKPSTINHDDEEAGE